MRRSRASRVRCTTVIAVAILLASACSGGRTESIYMAASGGDARRGRQLIFDAGCGACHRIPGVRGAAGLIGPPLDVFGRRAYIAGRVANKPENLVKWILDPHTVDPQTVMPRLGLDAQQARDVAAYLYTLQ